MKKRDDISSIVKKIIPRNILSGRLLYFIIPIILTIIIISSTSYLLNLFVSREDERVRKELIDKAKDVVVMLNPERVRKLTFTPSDINLPEYRRLHNQLVCIAKFKEIGFGKVYTIKMKPDGFYFGPEGYEPDDPLASPPGTKYEKAPAEIEKVFIDKIPITVGPYTDEYGSFISAFVPFIDPLTQDVLMVVGIDTEVNIWKDRLSAVKKVPLIVCWALLLIVYTGTFLLWQRQRMTTAKKWKMRFVESGITLCIGLILTLLIAYNVYINEINIKTDEFFRLGRVVASHIKVNFVKVRERIYVINNFFASSEYVSKDEFERFCIALMETDNFISSIGFVSIVPADDIQKHIIKQKSSGINNYNIFQITNDNKKINVKKDVYYPIDYLVSNNNREVLSIGFDISSIPEAYNAIKETLSTGLPTSTVPIISPVFPGYGSILIFSKVASHKQEGLIVTEVRLSSAISSGMELITDNIGIDVYHLSMDNINKEHIFSVDYRRKGKTDKNNRFHISLPLFFFGKVYFLKISGENLLDTDALNNWSVILTAGLLLTLIMSLVIYYLTTKQIVLEREVFLRTEDLRRQIQFEKFVAEISSMLFKITHTDAQYRITLVLKMLGEFVDVDRAYINLLSEDSTTVSLVYEWCREGVKSQMPFFQQIPVDMFPTLKKYLWNNLIIEIPDIKDVVIDKDMTEVERNELKREGVTGMLAIPLVWENRTIGFMGFDTVNRKKEWGETCHTLLKVIAGQITALIMKLKAEDRIWYLSIHDTLTGLYNRAYLEEEMERLDTERQLPLSMIMVDLNNLKKMNDTYGHIAGDEMLKKVADILKISCRKEDIVARWGGDEFVIFLPQTDVNTVISICNRIIENCKEIYVKGEKISIAIGCSTKENIEKDLMTVLNEAEEKMYKHKAIVKGNLNR
ncbi:MAG: diguanylate cyclase [bacterium]|nr:diguanylate cyclase [bacterium]